MFSYTLTNNLDETVIIYTTFTNTDPDDSSATADDYIPIYTERGSLKSGETKQFDHPDSLARVVPVRETNHFPIKVLVFLSADLESVGSIESTDLDITKKGWEFYKTYASQPYAPLSLQFTDLIENTSVLELTDKSAAFFTDNGYDGMDDGLFNTISYWATNELYAFPGTYYVYYPRQDVLGFELPSELKGTLKIENGKASYQLADGSEDWTLTFRGSKLSSNGATATSGVLLTAVIRDLTWEGKPDTITWAFCGTYFGDQMIVQSYEGVTLPWYAVLYDMMYGVFFTVNLAMMIDGAIQFLKTLGKGLESLANSVSKLVSKARDWINDTGETAGPGSSVGAEAEGVNVDVDVDVDIDVDVDVDVDIDVDVDVDVDIDVDVDCPFCVIDVDVDIDIDIDINTDLDTDIDIDVDIDVDTDVDVQSSTIKSALRRLGRWILRKALPTLLSAVALQVAFMSISVVFQIWESKDEEGISDLQPRETTGMGMLINYMFQSNKTIKERWDVFADYVEFSTVDVGELQMNVALIISTGNTKADADSKAWRWSTSDEDAAVNAMKKYSETDAYKAFQALGEYKYNGKDLPVKTGAAVALKYLKSL